MRLVRVGGKRVICSSSSSSSSSSSRGSMCARSVDVGPTSCGQTVFSVHSIAPHLSMASSSVFKFLTASIVSAAERLAWRAVADDDEGDNDDL